MVVHNSGMEPEQAVHNDLEDESRKQNDLLFKTTFKEFFGDLLELTEPDFAERVDLTNVEFLEQETFTSFPTGERHAADIVAKLTSKGGEERIVLVQAEVEGEFRTAMDRRAFYYYLYLRAKYHLPVLLIVVFLRGGQQGKGLTTREFVDRAEDREVCRFRYVAFFLGQNQAEDYVDLPQALAASLAALMKSDWEPFVKKTRCLRAIRRADLADAQHFLLAEVVNLHVELDQEQQAKFDAELLLEENKEVREMVVTWEEHLAASKAEGLLTSMRNSILQVLQRRLEAVPAFVRFKLDAIQSIERLEDILDQALVVGSADELVFEP